MMIFSAVVFGQEVSVSESRDVEVPGPMMEQIVKRILTWNFKPRTSVKTIELFDEGVKPEWLPAIKNVRFQMVSQEQFESRGQARRNIYFFTTPELSDTTHSIGFGFGDPMCEAHGTTWIFQMIESR